ncbi:MAG: glucose-6-phosphate isomerase family protein [Candidatus Dojkabacteria bacterium]
MAKIDLKPVSGLPIVYENDQIVTKDISFKEKKVVTIDSIRSQLLNKELDCPNIFYTKYKVLDQNNIYNEKGIKINVYTVKPNLAGIEFVKTKVTRCKNYPRIVEILYGGAILLLQRYRSPKDNIIYKVVAKKGQKIIVPPSYDMVVVNTRQNSTLIFAEYLSTKAISRVVLDDNSGIAYYVIRKNAKQEVVRNPNYKIVNEPEKIDMEKIIQTFGITPKTPVIKQIIRKYERFDWLFKENSISF